MCRMKDIATSPRFIGGSREPRSLTTVSFLTPHGGLASIARIHAARSPEPLAPKAARCVGVNANFATGAPGFPCCSYAPVPMAIAFLWISSYIRCWISSIWRTVLSTSLRSSSVRANWSRSFRPTSECSSSALSWITQ